MESFGRHSKEMVYRGKAKSEQRLDKTGTTKGLSVMYTNIDGIIPRKLELQDCLKE